MSWSLMGPVAAFTPRLPDQARAEISRRFPTLPLENIGAVFEEYFLFREARRTEPTAAQAQAEIQKLKLAVRSLRLSIEAMPPAVYRLVDVAGVLGIRSRVMQPLTEALQNVEVATVQAESRAPTGRRREPRPLLVMALADIVSAAGLAVDARPTGPLVTITGILLGEAARIIDDQDVHAPKDVRRVVQQALLEWQLPHQGENDVATHP